MAKVALLGYGVVGTGVVQLIEKNNERLRQNGRENFELSKILVRNKAKHIKKDYCKLLTDNVEEVFKEDVDIVIEVMGGLNPAYDYVKRALKLKKHVVTANKDLIAEHGKELLDLAIENEVTLNFEASVGGGIPILKPLRECLSGNEIKEIRAVLNGTTNFILSKMYKENMSYQDALKLAQKLGFAEAKPEADVFGYDAGRKLSILSTIAFDKRVDWKEINIEGITDIDEADFKYARKFKANIKLVGISRINGDKIYAVVKPMLVEAASTLGSIDDENNAIIVDGDAVGEVVFSGKGAGMLPTASAVFSDAVDTLTNKGKVFSFNTQIAKLENSWDFPAEWFLRFKTSEHSKLIKKLHEVFSVCTTETIRDQKVGTEVVALVKTDTEKILNEKLRCFQGNTELIKVLRKLA
jgi:homoserine dehydrogenase